MKSTKEIRRIVSLILFMFCMLFSVNVKAQSIYQIKAQNDSVQLYEGTELQKNVYVAVKKSGTGYAIVKPLSKDSKIYYFDAEGKGTAVAKSGMVQILYNGKSQAYYLKNGTVLTNQIVKDDKKNYYVDTTGVVITSKNVKKYSKKGKKKLLTRAYMETKALEYAVDFVVKHGGSGSNGKKLKKCYYYLSNRSHYPYQRFYEGLSPTKKDMGYYAYDMFKHRRGNCFRYAACFVYIAKVLGYDGKVEVGFTTSHSGGWTPHGWTKIKVNGKWYFCDPDMEQNAPKVPAYMKVVNPLRNKKTRSCVLTVKNGKVIWK